VERSVLPAAEGSEEAGGRPAITAPVSYLSDAEREALLNRLRRIEGQARGVQRLIEEREPCEAILVQIEAMRSALQGVKVALGGCYVKALTREAFPDRPDDVDRLAAEFVAALGRISGR
jgi:DNA-binding FrmR family transcriptional regulator